MAQHPNSTRSLISIQERYRGRVISVTVDPDAPSMHSVSVDLGYGLIQARHAVNELEPAGELVTFPGEVINPAYATACANPDPEEWKTA